jgi:hypothetical protein
MLDAPLRKSLASAAREQALSRYTWAAVVARILHLASLDPSTAEVTS